MTSALERGARTSCGSWRNSKEAVAPTRYRSLRLVAGRTASSPNPGCTSEVAVSCLIPFPAAAPVDDEPLWWFAHDDIDRLFDDATMLCPCLDCTEALRREASRRPRRPMGLKTGGDRI